MDDLRRQLQQLQERLDFYKNQGRGPKHHNSKYEAISDDKEENRFHYAHTHSFDGSTPPHPYHIKNLKRGYDMKVDNP